MNDYKRQLFQFHLLVSLSQLNPQEELHPLIEVGDPPELFYSRRENIIRQVLPGRWRVTLEEQFSGNFGKQFLPC